MSIYVSGIRLPFEEPEKTAISKAYKMCSIHKGAAEKAYIYKVSLDARRGQINRVYTVVLQGVIGEKEIVERINSQFVRYREQKEFAPKIGDKKLTNPPVVIGFGPAGLFAAYMLAKYGYRPIVIERGDKIDVRDTKVEDFWKNGKLDTECNIQFGEGGSGTYSDGKLTTRITDDRCEEVLKILTAFGAPNEILQKAKPHIGTDLLKKVVCAMRQEIIRLGGEVHFRTALTGITVKNHRLAAVMTKRGEIPCEQAVLAIGHSARDTFEMLHENGIFMQPKPFSVGIRIEHDQNALNYALYGKMADKLEGLPPAEYTLSHREGGRACYSFCMCPGGHVVAAQSEIETVVTNGMSYHARDGKNANSALAVSVDTSDFVEFSNGTPLGGIEFQRQIERAAFKITGSYKAPCQKVGDFLSHRPSMKEGAIKPTYPIGVSYGGIESCLPSFVTNQLEIGLRVFGRKIRGFDCNDALLTAPETRTSSPVRIKREDSFYSQSAEGLIPCGEGAGYAGGIMSAAVDGIRAAMRIMEQFSPIDG